MLSSAFVPSFHTSGAKTPANTNKIGADFWKFIVKNVENCCEGWSCFSSVIAKLIQMRNCYRGVVYLGHLRKYINMGVFSATSHFSQDTNYWPQIRKYSEFLRRGMFWLYPFPYRPLHLMDSDSQSDEWSVTEIIWFYAEFLQNCICTKNLYHALFQCSFIESIILLGHNESISAIVRVFEFWFLQKSGYH